MSKLLFYVNILEHAYKPWDCSPIKNVGLKMSTDVEACTVNNVET